MVTVRERILGDYLIGTLRDLHARRVSARRVLNPGLRPSCCCRRRRRHRSLRHNVRGNRGCEPVTGVNQAGADLLGRARNSARAAGAVPMRADGVRVPVGRFINLDPAITLKEIRAVGGDIMRLRSQLAAKHPRASLYFPGSPTGQLRYELHSRTWRSSRKPSSTSFHGFELPWIAARADPYDHDRCSAQPRRRFRPGVTAKLGWYVYLLERPAQESSLLRWQGAWQSVLFAYRRQTRRSRAAQKGQYRRLDTIRSILRRGDDVHVEILRHGIATERAAYELEAAVIDVLGMRRLRTRSWDVTLHTDGWPCGRSTASTAPGLLEWLLSTKFFSSGSIASTGLL